MTAAAVFSTALTGDVAVMGDEGSLGGDAAFTLGVRALLGGIIVPKWSQIVCDSTARCGKRVSKRKSRYNAMFMQQKLELVRESSESRDDVCCAWLVAEHNQIKSLTISPP